MSAPGWPLGRAPTLDEQRATARRARGQGRRWILRGILLAVVGVVGLTRGGGVMIGIGVVCLILSVLAVSLGRQTRRQAADIEMKVELMTQGSERGGAAGTVEGREAGR